MSPSDPVQNETAASRREFLKTTAAAALATAAARRRFCGPRTSPETSCRCSAADTHQYEAIHNWGELPSHVVWGETHGVAIDEAGLIYIKHRSSAAEPMDAIVVFDPAGKFVRSFGKEYHGGGTRHRYSQGERPGILVSVRRQESSGRQDNAGRRTAVEDELSPRGRRLQRTQRVQPDERGLRARRRILRGRRLRLELHPPVRQGRQVDSHLGRRGHRRGQDADAARHLARQPAGPRAASLVVADRANARLQYFTLDGKFQSIVNGVSFPAHFDIRGTDLLVPDLHARVTIMDKDNKVITHLGYDQAWTDQVLDGGKLTMRGKPERVAKRPVHPSARRLLRQDGNIFVVEWVPTGRVTKLRKVS